MRYCPLSERELASTVNSCSHLTVLDSAMTHVHIIIRAHTHMYIYELHFNFGAKLLSNLVQSRLNLVLNEFGEKLTGSRQQDESVLQNML